MSVEIHAGIEAGLPIIFRCMKADISDHIVTVISIGAAEMLHEFAKIVDITKAECAVAADRVREFGIIGVENLVKINLKVKNAMQESQASSRYSCGLVESFRCGEPEALMDASDSVRYNELIGAATSGNLWAVGELLASAAQHFDISEAFRSSAKTGQLHVIEFLYSVGFVNIDGVDDIDGNSALNSAATGGHLEVVKRLHQYGADINLKDFRLLSPLHSAVLLKKSSVVEYLCAIGAEMNTENMRVLNIHFNVFLIITIAIN